MTEKRGRIKQKILNHTPNTLVISGLHPVRALLKTGRVSEVWIREGSKGHRLSEVILESKMNNIFVKTVAARIFEDALPQVESNHQGVIAIARPREMEPENSLPILLDNVKNPLILVLDGITDPHNFGACLRSAEAFGVTCVVVPKDNSAPLNHIARKTSSGASEFIPVVRVTNLARCLKGLQKNGFWVIGAAGDSTGGLDQMEGAGSVALVMGSEGAGLRRLTRENCDALVSISMCGQIESLNVSVATGVLLFDLQTRRGKLDSDSVLKEPV
jgi:23S rRNA (guanosine2251-2'-O)-methyltransferase